MGKKRGSRRSPQDERPSTGKKRGSRRNPQGERRSDGGSGARESRRGRSGAKRKQQGGQTRRHRNEPRYEESEQRKKTMMIGGAVVGVIIIVVVLLSMGGSSAKKEETTNSKPSEDAIAENDTGVNTDSPESPVAPAVAEPAVVAPTASEPVPVAPAVVAKKPTVHQADTISSKTTTVDVSGPMTSKAEILGVPTFHCIGLYWSPKGGGRGKNVLVKFRKTGGEWRDGLPMKYNPIGKSQCKGDYRGSIVNLTPNTEYEIILELEGSGMRSTANVKTWNEEFKIAETIKGTNITSMLEVTKGGSAEKGYVLYDGTGCTIDCSSNMKRKSGPSKTYAGVIIRASYVIIRGYTIKNTTKYGIEIPKRAANVHHVVIENCDISKWGSRDKKYPKFGNSYQGGIYSFNKGLHHLIIQRCKIHHPSYTANSWAEKHGRSKHPNGPQAMVLYDTGGYHVIRYNEFWSDKDHYFDDVIGGGTNSSYRGYPGTDSDIYCNYVANCWDDGIEVEGGGQNVRVWGNYIENTLIAIGNAANSIGPVYFWRNASGKSYSPPGSQYRMTHGPFFKMGYAGSKKYMSGHFYCFNNTIFQQNNDGMKGFGMGGKPIQNCTTRNNIIHVRKEMKNSISSSKIHKNNDLDYDMLSAPGYPKGQEANAIMATPKYVAGAGFNFDARTGNFQLAPDSRGYDEGVVIPNFVENYKGKKPDIGAHEAGTPPIQYGVKANFVPTD